MMNEIIDNSIQYTYNSKNVYNEVMQESSIIDASALKNDQNEHSNYGFIGAFEPSLHKISESSKEKLYQPIDAPQSIVIVGIQGAGKSNTANCLVENYMLAERSEDYLLERPMATLACHFDTDSNMSSELIGIANLTQDNASTPPKVVVLVPPWEFIKCKAKYTEADNVSVYPLLFRWSTLSAEHRSLLMGLKARTDQTTPLYIATVNNLIIRAYYEGKDISYEGLKQELNDKKNGLQSGQSGPLTQRFMSLDNLLIDAKSMENHLQLLKDYIDIETYNVESFFEGGTVVICDMCTHVVNVDFISSCFEVLIALFKNKPLDVGKVVVLDEAHKYLNDECNLTDTIRELAAMRRHGNGLRVIVSTQDPTILPTNYLGLQSSIFIHKITSREWIQYLHKTVNLSDEMKKRIPHLKRGEAILYSSSFNFQNEPKNEKAILSTDICHVLVRSRRTRDDGKTKLHSDGFIIKNKHEEKQKEMKHHFQEVQKKREEISKDQKESSKNKSVKIVPRNPLEKEILNHIKKQKQKGYTKMSKNDLCAILFLNYRSSSDQLKRSQIKLAYGEILRKKNVIKELPMKDGKMVMFL